MAATCAKIILVVVNLIFFLLGLGFFVGGIFVRFGEKYYQPALDKFQDQIPDIAASGGFTDTSTDGQSKSPVLDIGGIVLNLAIALIVFGLFMLITSIMGMCGACCGKKCMLIIYIIIVGVLFLAKLLLLIILLTKALEGRMKSELKDIIKKKYGGIDDFGIESLSMNYVMLDYECCGVDNYKDFNGASKWNNERSVNVSGVVVEYELITPLACCKVDGDFPSVEIDYSNMNCTFAPTNANSNWKKGCWDKIEDSVSASKYIFAGVFGGVLAFELLVIILAACIIKKTAKEDEYA